LRDVIPADASDYGVDLAVAKIFVSYQPGTQRWEQLLYPNARWLTCKTDATVDQPLRSVHVNLLNGDLQVAGQPLGGLPRDIRELFRDVRICCSF
jgi:putative NIF3 family GTP cyclohydrolase 1 type 2